MPAFGCYLAGAGKPIWQLTGLLVLTVSGDRISAITRSDKDLARRFGLPEMLADPSNSTL